MRYCMTKEPAQRGRRERKEASESKNLRNNVAPYLKLFNGFLNKTMYIKKNFFIYSLREKNDFFAF